jgi:exopolyphosphatase/guanosine-5'-triphosphate,3'-diphosphate pyrophosphatase
MPEGSRRVAVIDIGSNSTRLLVADVEDGRVSPIEAACGAVDPYVATVREMGVEAVDAIATSAVRDAENGSAFIAELRERFALSARVLDGEEEARLTYMGATSETAPEVPTLVIDIGGGSTEMIVGEGRQIEFHTSLQAGVVRHSERHLVHDPPIPVELEALATDLRALIEAATVGAPRAEAGIAVAGTPTSLAAIELELEPYDPKRVHGHVLELRSIQRMLSRLASAPLAQRAEIPGLHADRAPTIVAGVVTLVEAMRAFDLERITVSEHDILYGAAIALADSI